MEVVVMVADVCNYFKMNSIMAIEQEVITDPVVVSMVPITDVDKPIANNYVKVVIAKRSNIMPIPIFAKEDNDSTA